MQKSILFTIALVVFVLNPKLFGDIGQGYSPIKPLSTIANISLLKPNGGELFYVGATDTIKWSSTNIANVKIEYTTNNGTNWITVIESTPAIAGTYFWNIPNTPSLNCKVRVSDVSNSTINAESVSLFTIMPVDAIVYGGKIYNTVTIGTQTWLKENLDIGTMIQGTQNATNNGVIEKYCYDNIPANCETYGGLYQWNEALQYVITPGAQGICPTGWHIPRLSEFQTLANSVGNNSNALKAVGQGSGSGAGTNTSMFSGLLVGIRYHFGSFGVYGISTQFWGSVVGDDVAAANYLGMESYNNNVYISYNSKETGFSVRCIKDIPPSVQLNTPNGGENWIAGTQHNITWTSVSINDVKLEYTTNNGTNWITIIASTPASNSTYAWTVPNTPSTDCRVRISDTSGNGIADTSESVFTIDELQIPIQIYPANNSKGIVQPVLTIWTQSLGAQKYLFQLSIDSTFATLSFVDSSLADTTKLLPTLSNYTQYYWRVKAVNNGGESNWSEVWNFKTLGNPYASTLMLPTDNSVNQPINNLVFKWAKAKERIETIQKYQYQLSTDSLFANIVVNDSTLTDTTKALNNLTYLTKYFWRVRASNETGWGDWSLVSRFTTIIEKPTTPILALPSNNGKGLIQPILTKWNNSLRVEKYHIQVSIDSTFATLTFVDSSLTDTTRQLPVLNNYTQYYWRVKAVNVGGESNWSEVWNFKTLGNPYASTLMLPTDNSVNQPINSLVFKWTKAKERIETIQKYQYQLATDSLFANIVVNDSTLTDTTTTANILAYLSRYYWRVRAINETGWGDWSLVSRFTTIIEKPTTPLLALPINSGNGLIQPIITKWNKSQRVEKYHLQVSTDSTFATLTFVDSSLTDTTRQLPALNNYTQYYWRVKAVNNGGESNWSEVWNFKMLGNPYASALMLPTENSVNQPINNLVFKWTKAKERIETIQKYQYQLSTDSLFANIVVNDSTLTDTTTTANILAYLSRYYWRVRASNETGWGDWSLVSRFTTIIEKPTTPALALPSNNGKGLIQPILTKWNSSLRVEKYHIQVSTDSTFATLTFVDSSLTDTSRQLPALNNYTQYYWRVKAVNVGGESDWSETWNFKTLGNPYASTLMLPTDNSVNQPINDLVFKWTKAKERIETIQKYQYQLSADSLFGNFVVNDSTLTDTTKTVNDLTYLTKYYWRVRASNETGWGDWSEVWKTTTIIEKPAAPMLASPLNNATMQVQPITLKWNKSLRVEKYRLEVSESSGFTTLFLVDSILTDTAKTLPPLAYPKTYYWRVSANNIGGTSSYSAVWNFRTLGLPLVVNLATPPNNSVNQPINNLVFKWRKAGEQTLYAAPAKGGGSLKTLDRTEMPQMSVNSFSNETELEQSKGENGNGIETVLNYWLQVKQDTNSAAFHFNDSTLTDTIKTVNSFGYLTSYYWRVKGKNETGWGAFSNWDRFTTIIEKPITPTLAAPGNDTTGLLQPLTVKWNSSLRAEKYSIQVSTEQTFGSIAFADSNITDTTKLLPMLSHFTHYYWRVKAMNIGGESEWSNVWNFRTLGSPTTVSLIYPGNNAINIPVSLSFKWTKANNQELAISYWFELSIDSTTILMLDSTLTDTTKSVTGLQNDKEYYWRVKAKNEAGWNNFSAWSKFRTIVPIPETPTLSSPDNYAAWISLTPKLIWRKVTYAENYQMQVATDLSFSNIVIDDSSIADTFRVLDTLLHNTAYYWRVRAKNISGNSNYSFKRKFTTIKKPVTAPSDLTATAPEYKKVNLSWADNSDNELGFVITRKTGTSSSSDSLIIIDTVGSNITVFSDTTIADSAQYSYRVYAFSSDTISAPSNFATVTTLSSVIEILSGEIPKEYSLSQNYPNPFNPVTTIQYGLPFTSEVNIAVYDMVGQKITTLVNREQNAGYYEVTFEIDGLSSGIYFYVITAKQTEGEKTFRKVMKMILMK